jgi:hypothetical protein
LPVPPMEGITGSSRFATCRSIPGDRNTIIARDTYPIGAMTPTTRGAHARKMPAVHGHHWYGRDRVILIRISTVLLGLCEQLVHHVENGFSYGAGHAGAGRPRGRGGPCSSRSMRALSICSLMERSSRGTGLARRCRPCARSEWAATHAHAPGRGALPWRFCRGLASCRPCPSFRAILPPLASFS